MLAGDGISGYLEYWYTETYSHMIKHLTGDIAGRPKKTGNGDDTRKVREVAAKRQS